jgi:hypothetical protein
VYHTRTQQQTHPPVNKRPRISGFNGRSQRFANLMKNS